MEIDERQKDKLVGFLRAELPKVRFNEGGRTLNYSDIFELDKGLSALLQKVNVKFRERLETYVGERPLVALALGVLSNEIDQIPLSERSGMALLRDCPRYRDTEALAKRIVAMVLALPHKYVVAIELPASLTAALIQHSAVPIIGRQLSIAGSWHDDRQGLPVPNDPTPLIRAPGLLSSLLNIKPEGEQREMNENVRIRSFLYIRFEGYFDPVFSLHPINRFTTLLKAFFGLAMSMNLLDTGFLTMNVKHVRYDVFDDREGVWEHVQDGEVSDGASALIRKLRAHNGARQGIVEDLRTIVQILDRDGELPQLVLGGRWFFDSQANSDEVMGFMQLAICAEAMLGTEGGADGLTSVLASRCGYLIAKSAKEREDLISEFKNIYRVRSKIVHNGLGSLRESERQQFRRLRLICSRIIRKEIELAMADDPERQKMAAVVEALHSVQAAAPQFEEAPNFPTNSE